MYVIDIECDSLNPTKIHCLSVGWLTGGEWKIKTTSDYDEMRKLMAKDGPFIMHWGQMFDRPALEKLLEVKIPYQKVIDTVAIGWYLYPTRANQKLESWGEEFGYPKVEVADEEWEEGDPEKMKQRCERDVEITIKLWEKQVSDLKQLYGEQFLPICRYVSAKMYPAHLQEKSKWKIDIPKCEENIEKLEAIKQVKFDALKKVLPPVPVKVKKNPPVKIHKMDGSLSTHGEKSLAILK